MILSKTAVILTLVAIIAATIALGAYLIISNNRQRSGILRVSAKNAEVTDEAAEKVKANVRHRNIQSALKELEVKQLGRQALANPPMFMRLSQAGLSWSVNQFYIISAIVGLGVAAGLFLGAQMSIWLSLLIGCMGSMLLPRFFVNFKRKRRISAFVEHLPSALDIIVRGIKSGFPLGECLRIVSNEVPDPVGPEFKRILDLQQIGMPLGQSFTKMYERVPTQEVNFLGIAISIQQMSGGNLSEALGNLSNVLRERVKLKRKILILAQEAKSSAIVVGSLPIALGAIISIMSPGFFDPLYNTTTGHYIIAAIVGLMVFGALTMRAMINIDL